MYTWHISKATQMQKTVLVYFQGNCPIKLLVLAKMTFELFQWSLVHKNRLPLALCLYYWFMAPLNTRKPTSFVIYSSKYPLVCASPLLDGVCGESGSGLWPAVQHQQRDIHQPQPEGHFNPSWGAFLSERWHHLPRVPGAQRKTNRCFIFLL